MRINIRQPSEFAASFAINMGNVTDITIAPAMLTIPP